MQHFLLALFVLLGGVLEGVLAGTRSGAASVPGACTLALGSTLLLVLHHFLDQGFLLLLLEQELLFGR